jgi:hypothetical protein
MPKREGYLRGLGKYSGQRPESVDGNKKDISRTVDSNHAKNDGFAAPLKPARE